MNPKTQFPASAEFIEMARHSGYIVYTCGPDRVDGTVYCAPEIYDPTNGTMSNGDIHRFGPGEPPESAMAGNMK